MRPLSSPLVQPLEAPYQALLDDLARARGWPTSLDVARLGAKVKRLSEAYNDADAAPAPADDLLAARLLFSFPRDTPKGAGAVRELVARGLLRCTPDAPLRVLDLGAGLGATTRGVARALAASGASGRVIVDAVDSDGAALDLGAELARRAPRERDVDLELSCRRGTVGQHRADPPYDLIVVGQVLSELDRLEPPEARVARHATLLANAARDLSDTGTLVVVEPALRARTRHLHAVRDALLRGGADVPQLHVLAPCVHDDPCPMLATEHDWCHEDLDVDLPPWLVPVARASGLRWEGLTFSFLALGRGARRSPLPDRDVRRLRVVSAPVVTKGKRELYLCGPFAPETPAARLKVTRLDRHASPENAVWGTAARGDLLTLRPPPDPARPRVVAETVVALGEAPGEGDRLTDGDGGPT